MTEVPTSTVTLLFSDIEGSTGLLKRLGDGWPGVLERQRALLRDAVRGAGGVVVDCQGDAMFAAFLAQEAWPNGAAVRVRVALHTGEPQMTEDGAGYAGIDVVRAARLCAAGHGGQVLLTETTRVLSGVETIDLGPTQLRDLDGPEQVYQLVAPGLAGEFPPLRANAASPLEDLRGEAVFDERIKRAEVTLEQRIKDLVAGKIEQAFGSSPGGRTRGKN
ncbi:MAG: adenylate/guanylate cyclase domain-containing protein [Chloroflexi bacterium]|nr:MAG: adenylate/guanylate cyclase domain-containing protein [Chloroflexota bacterium]